MEVAPEAREFLTEASHRARQTCKLSRGPGTSSDSVSQGQVNNPQGQGSSASIEDESPAKKLSRSLRGWLPGWRRAATRFMDDFGMPAVNHSFAAMTSLQHHTAFSNPMLLSTRKWASSTVNRLPHIQLPPQFVSVFRELISSLQSYSPSWRALASLFLVLAFFFWVANDCPPDCSLLPAVRPANSCSYSDADLARILRMPRGFKEGEARYYFQGRWTDFVTLQFELEMWKPHPRDQRASSLPCVLVSIEGRLPCLRSACVVSFYLRPLTSDVMVLKSHVEDKPFVLDPLYSDAVGPPWRFRSILDAGANIGMSTVLLALMQGTWILPISAPQNPSPGTFPPCPCPCLVARFPLAHIVAVEASEDNFQMLRLNTAAFPNVIALHAALWGEPGPPLVVHRDAKASGYAFLMVSEPKNVPPRDRTAGERGSPPFGVAAAVDVPLLASLVGLPSFDLLRLDIEGAEVRVLSPHSRGFTHLPGSSPNSSDPLWWARQAHMAIVSTHESIVPGSEQATRTAFPLTLFSIEFGPACSVFRRRSVFQDLDGESLKLH